MKNSFFILALLCATILVNSSCRKEQQQQNGDRPVAATIIRPLNPGLNGVLGTGHGIKDTIILDPNVAWRLLGMVYVDSGDVLICQCGTLIKAFSSSPTQPAGLVIARGAQFIAQGTANCPIIFTSSAPVPKPGDWAGITILGNASTNHPGRVVAPGLDTAILHPPVDVTFGGTTGANDSDSSGILKYIRIEYAGHELTPNSETDGLTLAGVGNRTVIDFVEVFKASNDAFQLLGGTVSAFHLIAADAGDDLFEIVNGYTGGMRYVLGLTDTSRADISMSNAIESGNDNAGSAATPITSPRFRKMTLIGLPNQAKATITNGAPSGSGRYGRAMHFRRNTNFDVDSTISLGYNFGISLDGAVGTTPAKYQANHVTWLKHTLSHAYFSAGTPVNISRYITETNGNPATGLNFFTTTPAAFYNLAIADGNSAVATVNAAGLANSFSRISAGNFMAFPGSPGETIAGGGAFPGGVNWVTTPWARLQ